MAPCSSFVAPRSDTACGLQQGQALGWVRVRVAPIGQTYNMLPPQDVNDGVRGESTVSISLPNDRSAPARARRAVRETFADWRLPALVDAGALAVSELVTNALCHGLPPLGLRMRRSPSRVRVDVNDARRGTLPSVGQSAPHELAESGRGLDLVRHVADKVGSELVPGDGKNVYASWNVDERSAAQ